MTYDALNPRSVVLRLEFSIADAVHQRGLLPVLGAAIAAWWNRPRSSVPENLSARMREDMGLPPLPDTFNWLSVPAALLPDPMKRWGM